MIKSADIVVVGAGFAGASTAYHLQRRLDARVIVLERESVPGAHASGKNAALAFQALRDQHEARLAVEGRGFIAAPPPGFCQHSLMRDCGSLLVGAGEQALRQASEEAARAGIKVECLSRKEAVDQVSLLDQCDIAGAIWNPGDGVVDIHALLQGYLRGQEVWYGCPVVNINLSRGRVESVETAKGQISVGVVVNAAGAWAEEVGRSAGASAISLSPKRRHLFQTVVDIEIDPAWPFVWHLEVESYFRPEGKGLLMSPCDTDPHPARAPATSERISEMLAEKVARAFPPLAEARISSAWACLRTFSADDRFVIGEDPSLGGFFWVAGLGGHGMTTSAAVGRVAAQAVAGERPPELAFFDPARLLV